VHLEQECFDLVTGVDRFRMGFEAVTETPRLVVKRCVVPGKEFNHAIAQHEIVVIAFTWQPTLGWRGILVSSLWHGSTTLYGKNLLVI
jgi:hypothetical protein